MEFTAREIYKVLQVKHEDEMVAIGNSREKARRLGNIFAVKNTRCVWARQGISIRNLFQHECKKDKK